MPIWATIIIVALVFIGAREAAFKNNWPTDISVPTLEISSTLEPTVNFNPESTSVPTAIPTEVIIPTATPTTIIIPPTQAPTPNVYKEIRLKQIEVRLNEIDRTIASYQSNINYYLEEEKKAACHTAATPEYYQPEAPPGPQPESYTPPAPRMLDPMIKIQSDYLCSMSFISQAGELKTKINALEKEKRDLELEKTRLFYQ